MREIIIAKKAGINHIGETIVFDKTTGKIDQIPIALYPCGTKIKKNKFGEWYFVRTEESDLEASRIKCAEDFYYQTKSFLPYLAYLRVLYFYPTSANKRFLKNPWFLTNIKYENETPITSFPQIDKAVTLSTFKMRLEELRYAMDYVLTKVENEGHTWISVEEFDIKVRNLLNNTGHPLNGSIRAFLSYYDDQFFCQDGKVAKLSTYNIEKDIYKKIKDASKLISPFPRFLYTYNDDLSPEQNKAISELPTKGGNFSILTGGPGTGKTTILKEIVDSILLLYPSSKIHLLSPTGKATRRIQEVFGSRDISVQTIHKFLGYGHELTRREYKEIRSADLIFIDEASMLDLEIFSRFLSLVDITKTKIILVGDVDQLPSIGMGNILHDLIFIGVHTCKLTSNFRSNGSIVTNAHSINAGNIILKEDDSFQIIETPEFLHNIVLGTAFKTDIAITPYRVGISKVGASESINPIIQKQKFGYFHNDIQVGDKVIVTKTNYKIGYFNGEVGTVVSKLLNGDTTVDFEDRQLVIKNPEHISLAYAITVHKSQGSEYDTVIISVPSFETFYTRRMLYTAITRAKGKVIIIGNKKDIIKVIMNNKDAERRTFLSSFENIKVTKR